MDHEPIGPSSALPSPWAQAARRLLPPAAVGLVLLVLAALALRPRTGPATPAPPPKPPLPREYATVARILADPLAADPNAPDSSHGLTEVIEQLRGAEADLHVPDCPDAELAEVAAEARAAVREIAAHAERWAAIPAPPGHVEVFAESFVRGFLFDIPGILARTGEVLAQDKARREAIRAAWAAVPRFEAIRLALPTIAARYAGPAVAGRAVLALDFDSA